MGEWDDPKEDLGHPDSAIRLASAVHRFKMPRPNPERKLSFAQSFRSAGSSEKTRRAILQAVRPMFIYMLARILVDALSHISVFLSLG
jgi:glutamyl/glutaminyl-tRNA synthetase